MEARLRAGTLEGTSSCLRGRQSCVGGMEEIRSRMPDAESRPRGGAGPHCGTITRVSEDERQYRYSDAWRIGPGLGWSAGGTVRELDVRRRTMVRFACLRRIDGPRSLPYALPE